MTAIIAALVNHPRVVSVVACIALLVLGGFALIRLGEQRATTKMQATTEIAQRRADSAMATTQAALVPVRHENDSLRAVSASLRTRAESLSRAANERRTAANIVQSRLVLHGDTARVSTDTGVIAIPIPEALTRQLAADRLVTDSLISAMDRRHEADSAWAHSVTDENNGLRTQIGLDSIVVYQYRKQLAAAEARAAAAEAKPHRTFSAGVIAGALVAVVARVAVAVLTHH